MSDYEEEIPAKELQSFLKELAEKGPNIEGSEPVGPEDYNPVKAIAPEYYCVMDGCDNPTQLRIRTKAGDNDYEVRVYCCDEHFEIFKGDDPNWITSPIREPLIPEKKKSEDEVATTAEILDKLQRVVKTMVESRVDETGSAEEIQAECDRIADDITLAMQVGGAPFPRPLKLAYLGDEKIAIGFQGDDFDGDLAEGEED
ncbi:MAG TPA: hypothetical protein VJ742_12675 [Nitrososphaera sp.]|nr:hypothetical protein [Nitrososphaera sp.]